MVSMIAAVEDESYESIHSYGTAHMPRKSIQQQLQQQLQQHFNNVPLAPLYQ